MRILENRQQYNVFQFNQKVVFLVAILSVFFPQIGQSVYACGGDGSVDGGMNTCQGKTLTAVVWLNSSTALAWDIRRSKFRYILVGE